MLSRDINVIYRTTVPAGYTNPYMVFFFNGEETVVSEYTTDANGKLCFAFMGINPQKMGDNISATLHATYGGEDVTNAVATYSIRQYCVNQLAKNPDAKLKTMISDLLVYGAKTQIYQNYKPEQLVTEGLSLTPSTFETLDASYNKLSVTGEADPKIRYSSATLQLSNSMTVLLGITTDDPTDYTFEVTVNGNTSVFDAGDLSYDGGKYYLAFRNVKATAFDSVITAVIKKDGVTVSEQLTYSVCTYIQKNQGSSNAELAELLKAIYRYGESAKMYEE